MYTAERARAEKPSVWVKFPDGPRIRGNTRPSRDCPDRFGVVEVKVYGAYVIAGEYAWATIAHAAEHETDLLV